jgi:c-di-GMP-binding flagellar brake protein YcgR
MHTSDDAPVTQQRKSFRVQVLLPVEVHVADVDDTSTWRRAHNQRRILATTTQDLSFGGLRFSAAEALAPGTPLTCVLHVNGQVLAIPARVTHCGGNHGMHVGVQFRDLPHGAEHLLRQVIATHQRRSLPRIEMSLRVRCYAHGVDTRGITVNCSPGGLTLALDDPIPVGTTVECRVTHRGLDIALPGKVVSCSDADQPDGDWRLSIQLDELPPIIGGTTWRDLILELRGTAA